MKRVAGAYRASVLQAEVLILHSRAARVSDSLQVLCHCLLLIMQRTHRELGAVDGLATGSVAVREVSTLTLQTS